MPGIPKILPYAKPASAELLENMANWTIDPKRAVLLIHDMQRFFIRHLPHENPKSILIENSALIRKRCLNLKVPVAYTAQTGGMTEEQRGLLRDFWGMGMKVDPVDRLIVNELTPNSEDWIFTKWRYSAFHKSGLLEKLRQAKRDQLIICGVYAHIGILMTAVDAFSNDIETFIIADAIADFSYEHHLMALNYACQRCAMVVFSKEVMV